MESSIRQKPFRLPRTLEVLLGLVVIAELTAPFVTKMYGIDARFHLLWIGQFSTLLSEGVLIPTWVPSGFLGFGSTTFYFYPPLTYYLAAVLHFLTGIGSPTILYQSVSFLATIASFFSARIFLQKIAATKYQSMLGALLYAVAPLRLFELYNRGTLSTHLAYVFLPLVALGVVNIYQRSGLSKTSRMLSLAVPMTLLALTSVPITLSTAMCIGIAFIVSWRGLSVRIAMEMIFATVLTAAFSAYHYASVLKAEPYAHLIDFNFVHFPRDILLWFHPGSGTYNLLLIYAMAGIILAAYIVARKKRPLTETERKAALLSIILSAFVFFLDLSPLSYWLWNTIAFQLIQIPWRFYPQLLLMGVVVVAVAHSKFLERAAIGIAWLCAAGALVPLIIILSSWHSIERVPAEDIAYAPYVLAGSESMDFLTSHTPDAAFLANPQAGERIQEISGQPYTEEFHVTLSASDTASFHRFYWPFWHLYAMGREIPSHPDSIGRAAALLPAGNYIAVWRFERTPLELGGLWISGIAWGGLLIFWGIGLVQRRVRGKSSPSP
ncbi:MAG TPA: hypothetical protein VFH95_14490 [Candidatus Kapabacteria bacterium]|nr:hypothetical protein [Candidatus Kapabacteria bacterium]